MISHRRPLSSCHLGVTVSTEGGPTESDFIYEAIICPSLQTVYGPGCSVLREVDNRNPGAITRHIVQHIASADVCIVDVTGQNPNVFLELGIRYALRKGTTVLLKQPQTHLPFDIAGYRCVEYLPRFHGVKDAMNNLTEALTIARGRGDESSDSLVFEVYPNLLVNIPGVIEARGDVQVERHMDWREYMEKLALVADKLRDVFQNGRYVPDVVLGISNGGLVYADLIGRTLFAGIPVQCLWANRRDPDGKFFENPINGAVIGGIRQIARKEKPTEVLLVDDIVASGTTLQQAIVFFKAHLPEAKVRFLPLFSRNAATFDTMKDVFLWSSPPLFSLSTADMIDLHSSRSFFLA